MGGRSVAGVDVVVCGPDPNDTWAEVMYLAPKETGEDVQKLRRIADLVNSTFRREGYIVEKRALKLHCTLLNTSKRRPARTTGQPFSYSDLLRSDAMHLLRPPPADPPVVGQTTFTETSTSTSGNPINFTSTSTTTTKLERTSRKAPAPAPPVLIDFGVDQYDEMIVRVEELGCG
ncbi:hypothetical protein FPV67DRAFT_461983 [Lyophyllum atratum]|nr:hypothetical protein FPV67DRAFT_461983 [Lyophyllum atratum]